MNSIKSLLVGLAMLFVTIEARPMKCNLCLTEVIELGKRTTFCSKQVMNDYSACYIHCATPKDGEDLYTTLDLMSEFLDQMEENGCSLNGYYNNECHNDFRICIGYSVNKFMDTRSTEDLCSIAQYKKFSKCGYERQHDNAYDICYFMYWKIDMVHKLAAQHCPADIVRQFLIINAEAREESNQLKRLYRLNNRQTAAQPRNEPKSTTEEVNSENEPETPRPTPQVQTTESSKEIEEIEGPPEGIEFFEPGNNVEAPTDPRGAAPKKPGVDIFNPQIEPTPWPITYVERARIFPTTPKTYCKMYGAKFMPKDGCHKYNMEVNGKLYKDLVVPKGTMFDTIQCSLWHENSAYCGLSA